MGTTAARVPAWKKLGLKLKYAKETPLDDGVTEEKCGDGKGEGVGVNGEVGSSGKEKKGKKRRFDEEKEDKDKNEEKDEGEKDSTPKSKKKKRVSFTADTKVRDGEEGEGDVADGVSVSVEDKDGGKSGMPDQQPTDEDGDDEQSATEVKEKKKKKKEKGKKKDGASTDSTQIHETPILSYLSHYYKYRPTWKFQKNRETHLFKHVLSLEQVPPQYNAALLAYLQGLKSEGAKQRLHQTAEEVVKNDIENKAPVENGDGAAAADEKEDGDTPNATDYDKAVDAFRAWLLDPKEDFDYSNVSGQLDDDTRKKLGKRQRAELMIYAVLGKLFTAEKPKPAKEVRPKKVAPGKKKRKNRTAIVEISSSSESESESSNSSSSDSDSDSDSHSDNESGKPNGAASKTSSSDSDSSSDSSSDTDSDSDSTSSSDSSSSSSS